MEHYKNLSLEDIVYTDDNGVTCVEQWKDIPDYEGYYQASDLGRIKAMPKHKNHSSGKRTFLSKEKILKQSKIQIYCKITLYLEKISNQYLTHQLIAITFLNHIPNRNVITVDHINNIKHDNRLINLQLITPRENSTKDSYNKTGYTGINKRADKFQALIQFNGKNFNLGTFDSPALASKKYQEAVLLINQNKDITHLIIERFNENGFTGVCKNKNRFQARINHKGKFYSLGNYDTQEEAGEVYLKALDLSKQNKPFDHLINRYESQTKSKGVSVSGNKFRVRVYSNGKNIGLGTYDTLEEANNCYDEFIKNKKANLN
jgi:hypothetical protein